MDPRRRLCTHLSSPLLPRLARQADDVLDWEAGATVAVVRCPDCDACGLLELLDWTPDGRVRVFALCALGADEVALFQRDVQRGSCDPARMTLEQQALFASAGPAERVIALDAHGEALLANAAWPDGTPQPNAPWRERLPAHADTRWFEHLGLEKT